VTIAIEVGGGNKAADEAFVALIAVQSTRDPAPLHSPVDDRRTVGDGVDDLVAADVTIAATDDNFALAVGVPIQHLDGASPEEQVADCTLIAQNERGAVAGIVTGKGLGEFTHMRLSF
jgi:hypothetical protein